jgi:hypothetical protein
VQMGRIQPAALVAHRGRTGAARTTNGGAGGGPTGSSVPAAGAVKDGR